MEPLSTLPYCLATGVEAGRRALHALCEADLAPRLVLGYDKTLSHRSGYVDVAPVAAVHGLRVHETADINGPDVLAVVRPLSLALLVVAGWSQIVNRDVLQCFTRGAVGLHPTRLPEGRGRAPIPWTLIKGITTTAVSLFVLESDVDAGDIVAQFPIEVSLRDNAGSLYEKIADAHAAVLVENIGKLVEGSAAVRPQEGTATWWPRRRPDDGAIDWSSMTGEQVYNWIRGLSDPYPGAFSTLPDGRRLTLWEADWIPSVHAPAGTVPGTILGPVWSTAHGGLCVAAREGSLIVLRSVQVAEESSRRDGLALYELGVIREGERLG